MNRLMLSLLFVSLYLVSYTQNSSVSYTSDGKNFNSISSWKEALKDVKIVALGENTHGLEEVFQNKVELVKFLHEELGFNILLFETGFGDGALSWSKAAQLSAKDHLTSFSSYDYYHSEALYDLFQYIHTHKNSKQALVPLGIDCQPQQDFLKKEAYEFAQAYDPAFAKTIRQELQMFNMLYQYEYDKDSINFYKQRDQFQSFLDDWSDFIIKHANDANHKQANIFIHCIAIFKETYRNIQFGDMLSFPNNQNIRDKAMYQTVERYRQQYPNEKIIIWTQNSHIENKDKPQASAKWMGHYLKEKYGNAYYSVGAIVYKGNDLIHWNQEVNTFEHDTPDYLAYHLNKLNQKPFLFDLRQANLPTFLTKPLLGMESGGSAAYFIPNERFDGLLFIPFSDIPKKIED